MDRRAMVQTECSFTVLSGEVDEYPDFPMPVLFAPTYVTFGAVDQAELQEVAVRWLVNEPPLNVDPDDASVDETGQVTLDGRTKQPAFWAAGRPGPVVLLLDDFTDVRSFNVRVRRLRTTKEWLIELSQIPTIQPK